MTAMTMSAIGTPIDSPRPRSLLKIFWVSWLIAGIAGQVRRDARRVADRGADRGVAFDASWFSSGVAICA